MWLSSRMDSIENLCKEFIDQEEKDDLLDDNVSEQSDLIPESNNNLFNTTNITVNYKNTSLSNLNNNNDQSG